MAFIENLTLEDMQIFYYGIEKIKYDTNEGTPCIIAQGNEYLGRFQPDAPFTIICTDFKIVKVNTELKGTSLNSSRDWRAFMYAKYKEPWLEALTAKNNEFIRQSAEEYEKKFNKPNIRSEAASEATITKNV